MVEWTGMVITYICASGMLMTRDNHIAILFTFPHFKPGKHDYFSSRLLTSPPLISLLLIYQSRAHVFDATVRRLAIIL